MTEQTQIGQTENRSAGPQGHTGGARLGAEREINPYLYENLVSNLEAQIASWIRRADRESNPEVGQAFRWKAEGLGYALRLLYVFKPDFDDLVEKAGVPKCRGCGRVLKQDGRRPMTRSALCDACYEIGRDEGIFRAENAADFDGQLWL